MTLRDIALTVCGYADTSEDAEELLSALGMLDGAGGLTLPEGPMYQPIRNIKAVVGKTVNWV